MHIMHIMHIVRIVRIMHIVRIVHIMHIMRMRMHVQVSLPGGMEQPAQRRRWILPLPTRFGMDETDLAPADSGLGDNPGCTAQGVQQSSVQFVRRRGACAVETHAP